MNMIGTLIISLLAFYGQSLFGMQALRDAQVQAAQREQLKAMSATQRVQLQQPLKNGSAAGQQLTPRQQIELDVNKRFDAWMAEKEYANANVTNIRKWMFLVLKVSSRIQEVEDLDEKKEYIKVFFNKVNQLPIESLTDTMLSYISQFSFRQKNNLAPGKIEPNKMSEISSSDRKEELGNKMVEDDFKDWKSYLRDVARVTNASNKMMVLANNVDYVFASLQDSMLKEQYFKRLIQEYASLDSRDQTKDLNELMRWLAGQAGVVWFAPQS